MRMPFTSANPLSMRHVLRVRGMRQRRDGEDQRGQAGGDAIHAGSS